MSLLPGRSKVKEDSSLGELLDLSLRHVGICQSCREERELIDGVLCEECFCDSADEDAQEIDFETF